MLPNFDNAPLPSPAPHGEAELARLRERNQEFVRLFSLAEMRIHAYLLTLVPHWADAEELLQETSLVLWEKFEEFQTGTDFVRWACQTAHFKALNFRRKQQHDRLMFSEAFLETVAAKRLEQADELDERRQQLHACLSELRVKDREIVRECYLGEKSVRAAAIALGRPADTLYKALHRIRQTLLECMQGKHQKEGAGRERSR